jgi:hypothetical protein
MKKIAFLLKFLSISLLPWFFVSGLFISCGGDKTDECFRIKDSCTKACDSIFEIAKMQKKASDSVCVAEWLKSLEACRKLPKTLVLNCVDSVNAVKDKCISKNDSVYTVAETQHENDKDSCWQHFLDCMGVKRKTP